MSRILTLKSKKGFTLIELVAVIAVLGICLAPFGALFYTVMGKYAEPEAIQIATALAENEMERVTGLSYANVVNEGPTVFTNFPNYTYQVDVSIFSGQPDTSKYKVVEVRVVNSSVGVTTSLFTISTIKQDI